MRPYETAFYETLRALGQEHLDNLIVVGGWCPYLYVNHVWKQDQECIMTMDIDFAVKKMNPDRFSEPVYNKLLAANLTSRRMDMDDDNRFQFAYVSGKTLIPIEFITAPHVLPTGQKQLSVPYTACDPVPEVAIALKIEPIRQTIEYQGGLLNVQIAHPAAFVVVKSLLLEHRVNATKHPRDLASIGFVLRFAPDRNGILKILHDMRADPAIREANQIIAKYVGHERKPGIQMLGEYYEKWGVTKDRIATQVVQDFTPLLEATAPRTRRPHGPADG